MPSHDELMVPGVTLLSSRGATDVGAEAAFEAEMDRSGVTQHYISYRPLFVSMISAAHRATVSTTLILRGIIRRLAAACMPWSGPNCTIYSHDKY